MAAKSNLTAVHFTLIFTVMLTIILAVVAYLNHRDLQIARNEKATADERYDQQRRISENLDDEVQALKGILGEEQEDVGVDNPDDETTVLGAVRAAMRNFGGAQAQPDAVATFADLRRQLDIVTADRDQLRQEVATEQQTVRTLSAGYDTQVQEHKRARDKSEQDLQTLVADRDKALAQKNQDLAQAQSEITQLKLDLNAEKDAHRNAIKDKDQYIDNLKLVNTNLQERIDEESRVSFERADGMIYWVDTVSRKVWINLGEVDLLPMRTTFSVYTKAHHGVGRGQEDIKGAIEITKIIGPHMAEARILDEDIHRPMTKGDPIYTPLWSPGRPAKFALVGLIDIDGDGQGDRHLLHDLIASTGSEITAEVNDKGEYNGVPITVDTKYLVVGEIPSPVTGTPDDDKQVAIDIGKQYKVLEDQARLAAVQRINLNDFLSYIGYKPQRRLWKPGMEAKYTLKQGAHSTATTATIGDRSSSGQVSRRFTNRSGLRQESSSGQTSGAYGTGGQ